MLELVNQQVTSSWFAGILDGEGSFLRLNKNRAPRVRIFNSDLGIIEACESFLKDNYICFERYASKKLPNRKRMYEISITDHILMYPKILYELIEDKLECRREQYQRILGTSTTLRPLSVDLDWLAGMFEAEGSISITRRYGNCKYESAVQIQTGNTNKRIIDKIILNLRESYLPYYIWHKEATDTRKEAWFIKISGMLRCRRFLYAVKGKWVSPRNQKRASLMSDFIESRLSKKCGSPYSEQEERIIQSITDLNR